MRTSLLRRFHIRTELFSKGQVVNLRDPAQETEDDAHRALSSLQKQIGSGPFQVVLVVDTPSSPASPQRVALANPGSNAPLRYKDGGTLWVSGYYLLPSVM
jgi:hypothetical protein